MNYILVFSCFIGLAAGGSVYTEGNPIAPKNNIDTEQGFVDELMKYNYLPNKTECTEHEIYNGAIKYQRYNHLNETGEADEPTKAYMRIGRCANKDNPPPLPEEIQLMPNDFEDSGYSLTDSTVTYNFKNYPTSGLTQAQVDEIFARAAAKWAAVTCLNFVQTDAPSIIEVQFATGDYGGITPFDGQGGILGTAYPPYPGLTEGSQGGDIDIDDDEVFTDGCGTDPLAINLEQEFLHEIGHSLGLLHSDVAGSVMQNTYAGGSCISDPQLSQDDIDGIQSKYNFCTTTDATTTTTAATTTTTEAATTTTTAAATTTTEAATTTTTAAATTTTEAATTTTTPATTTTTTAATTTTKKCDSKYPWLGKYPSYRWWPGYGGHYPKPSPPKPAPPPCPKPTPAPPPKCPPKTPTYHGGSYGSRYGGSHHYGGSGSRYGGSRYGGSRYGGSRYGGSSRYRGSRYGFW